MNQANIAPFLRTRYDEIINENDNAWTVLECENYDYENETSQKQKLPVQIVISKILTEPDGNKKALAVICDDKPCNHWKSIFVILNEDQVFVSREDAKQHLLRHIITDKDPRFTENEKEGWKIGDTTFVYNPSRQKIVECTIIEFQKGPIHADAIIIPKDSEKAFEFEDKCRRGRKLAYRVDILHKSADKNTW